MNRHHATPGVLTIAFGVGVLLSVQSGVSAQPTMLADSASLGPPDPSRSPNNFSDYKCLLKDKCSTGLLLADQSGDPVGCVASEAPQCTGSCISCDGANASTYVCVSSTGDTCTIPEVYRIVSCGAQRSHTNGCTSTQPSGVPSTPSGCYCNLSASFNYLTANCSIGECG